MRRAKTASRWLADAADTMIARREGKRGGGSTKGWRWKVSDEQVTAIHDMRSAGKKITHIARVDSRAPVRDDRCERLRREHGARVAAWSALFR